MPARRLLVTGDDGFVGSQVFAMAQEIRKKFGWELTRSPAPYDLRDPATLAVMLGGERPDGVLHLAGISFVPDSYKDPKGTFEINFMGTLHLLQALKKVDFEGPFLYVSSGDVYGRLRAEDLPVDEKHLPYPANPYAVSKLAAEALCRQWALIERCKPMVARPFNHIGRGQREEFVLATMARQIVRIRQGLQEPVIHVGDIDTVRDFLDVRDVINAYLRLLDLGSRGEIYNVCSGTGRRIRELIDQLKRLAGVEAELQLDPERFRPSEQRAIVGNNRKLVEATAWQPEHALDETLAVIIADWENRSK